jgi:hypothetical protein
MADSNHNNFTVTLSKFSNIGRPSPAPVSCQAMSGIVTWEEVMPLVQVDLPRALFEEKGTRIGNEVHQAFIDARTSRSR